MTQCRPGLWGEVPGRDNSTHFVPLVQPPQKAPMKFPKEVVLLSKSTAAVFVGLLTTSAGAAILKCYLFLGLGPPGGPQRRM